MGVGGAWLGRTEHGTDEELGIATVLRALELGLNLIDTSGGYIGGGRSEAIIGEALARWYARGGRREELVISTKTGTRNRRGRGPEDYSAAATWASIETSLKALKTDYLDVALVHDPLELDSVLGPDGAWSALKAMREQGIVRAIGLGARPHDFHRRIIATGESDVALTFRDYNLLDQSAWEGVMQPAAEAGVGIFLGTSLYHGLLSGGDPLDVLAGWANRKDSPHYAPFAEAAHRAHELWIWCQDWGVSLLALNLQYCARSWRGPGAPGVTATLMGAANPAQIEADVAALSAEIPEAMWAALGERMGELKVEG
jgi:D-threo-aldose 1-dehydrogenase